MRESNRQKNRQQQRKKRTSSVHPSSKKERKKGNKSIFSISKWKLTRGWFFYSKIFDKCANNKCSISVLCFWFFFFFHLSVIADVFFVLFYWNVALLSLLYSIFCVALARAKSICIDSMFIAVIYLILSFLCVLLLLLLMLNPCQFYPLYDTNDWTGYERFHRNCSVPTFYCYFYSNQFNIITIEIAVERHKSVSFYSFDRAKKKCLNRNQKIDRHVTLHSRRR